ncbi:SAM-dependent chlorinase/fluorinase [Flavobacterium sp. CYK-4]|uniref:SAM hydrolase/SAM-dependent halogenase family protein n=1 Tax=Flavobacterium lotistagni TaxID=2709660 RepID=UPI00140A9599|nr:SAM-dependent chlorinase/fluorinase [Flavobacterium lotistagni]NHM07904.1 SAM-dependent chlorinase/fluorinase [Flavobacterium lotistagni]
MSIITLTTDYGLRDHFVGALKGKILSDFAQAVIVDISHDIDLFNTTQASYIIGASYSNFPKGSIHLIGVDLERNNENQHLAMQWNDHYFICADNGILSMLTQYIKPQKIVSINIHDRLPVEATDLDVFVKVACHIAKGGLLNVIGKEIFEIKQITELQPVVASDKNSIKGHVIYVDHFGNVVTNISKKLFLEIAKGRPYEIPVMQGQSQRRSVPIKNIWAKYSDISGAGNYPIKNYEGDKLAIFNEAGYLEIAIFRSNPKSVGTAESLLGLSYRDTITINFK